MTRGQQPARVRAVIAAGSDAATLSDWLTAVLEAVELELGFARSSLLLVLDGAAESAGRAYAGALWGWEPDVLADYFEHWAELDPLAGDAAQAMFQADGYARTAALYPQLDEARRRFVDQFLRGLDVADQMSLRLAGNSTTACYLTVHERHRITEPRQRALRALAPDLSSQLRGYLPHGLPYALSPRERQTAELLAFGMSNQEISAILNVGPETVKKTLHRAMKKLGFNRRTQLAVSWTTGRPITPPIVHGVAPQSRR